MNAILVRKKRAKFHAVSPTSVQRSSRSDVCRSLVISRANGIRQTGGQSSEEYAGAMRNPKPFSDCMCLTRNCRGSEGFSRINARICKLKKNTMVPDSGVFDVIFEILQSPRSMHFSGIVAGIAFVGATGALAQPELGSSTIPPTVGLRTNAVTLSATNFVARTAGVSNGVFFGSATHNVPPTSIFGPSPTVRPLTIQDAIQEAVANNFDVQILRLTPEIARFNLAGSYAVYEPTLQLDGVHSFVRNPGGGLSSEGIPIPPSESETDSFGLDLLNGYAPTGLRYSFGGGVQHTKRILDDEYTGGAVIDLRQPLLRNFWIDANRAEIMVNKKRLQIAEWQFRRQLITTIASVEIAYYDLIRTRENIKVQRTALD